MSFDTEVRHPALADPLQFSSLDDVAAWAVSERDFWSGLGVSGIHGADRYVREATTFLERLREAATKPAMDQLESLLASLPGSLPIVAASAKGRALASMKDLGRDPKAITVALTEFISPSEVRDRRIANNDHWTFDAIVGTAHAVAVESGGDPERLFNFLNTIKANEARWDAIISAAEERTEVNRKRHDEELDRLRESIRLANENVAGAISDLEAQVAEFKHRYEEQFVLRTPMTYWSEKAERHRERASAYRRWFTGLLIGGIVLFVAAAAAWLVPFMLKHSDAYWAILLFSVVVAVWAWPLRMTSRLYLTHQHLFEDAKEREIIAQTFLALADQVETSADDRRLLLAALMRHAPVALVSDDSGINLADMVMSKMVK